MVRRGSRHQGRRPGWGLVLAAVAVCVAALLCGFALWRLVSPGESPQGAPSPERASVSAGNEGDGASSDVTDVTANVSNAGAQDEPSQTGNGDTTGDASSGTAPQVEAAISPLVSSTSGVVSVAYASLDDPSDACYLEADRQLRSASMIKLAILAEYLREVDAGILSGQQTYALTSSDIVGGTGSLQGRGAGYTTTLDTIASLMITESDNVAANVLIDRMGMDAINAEASALGLTATRLERKMMDSAAVASGRDNYTSARDVARILTLIGRGELVSADASQTALRWLERQTDRTGIPAGLPANAVVGNKTGSLDSARHDGAIVLGDYPYVLVVMTDGLGGDAADELIAQVSAAVWNAVEQ